MFVTLAPAEGWRHAGVTDSHAARDHAHVLQDLSDLRFPDAGTIAPVRDNLDKATPF